MEELADGALKGVLRLIGVVVRALIWLAWEVCFEVVAWYVGWPICRALSFGNLPKESITEHERASNLTQFIVSIAGLLSLFGTAFLIAQLVGQG